MKKFCPTYFNFPKHLLGVFVFLFCGFSAFAQDAHVDAKIDTSSIKIGEQIKYSLEVETDSTDLIVFPVGETFSPLEVVESFNPDTSRVEDRFRLIKEYSLTQFDSGQYVIPQQKVIIADREYTTDSLLVEVADVEVDTSRQKMYPIKPSVEIPQGFRIPAWVWWLLVILALAALVFYLFRRRKIKEAEKGLPPYEQVMFELNQLDQSPLLERREIKEYYSQLTFSVRNYLDREIYDRALESTTSELIAYLEMNKSAGKLKLDNKTIKNLKLILDRADLAKFANSRPDMITAKNDRSKIEHIVKDVKTAVPEPSEEELMKDEAYKEERLRKKKQRRLIIAAVAACVIVVVGIWVLVATKGFTYVKDSLLGHPTKELLESEWIRSEYGNPPVAVTTPEVLKRSEIDLPEEAEQMMLGSETFEYGSLISNFYTTVTTVNMSPQTEFDLEKSVDGIYTMLEQQGARNNLMKDEAYKEERLRKKKQRRLIIAAVAACVIVVAGIWVLVATKGFTYVKDSLLGHPTKELLESEWIRSEYGNPPVAVTTPEVLKRSEIDLPEEAEQMMLGSETFEYGSLISNFYTTVTTVNMSPQTEFDLEKSVDGIYTMLEQQGARNIIMKDEEFTTATGVEGIRIYGTLEMENPVTGKPQINEYEILNFVENNGFQQIMVIYKEGDNYAEEISGRIINSVEFNSEN